MERNDRMVALERKIKLLQLHLIDGKTQREIARRMNLTPTRVSQLIGRALDEVIIGKIGLPADYDISKSKLLVDKMLFYACVKSWTTCHEVNQNYQVLSQLTIPEKLAWIKKSGKIRWYR